MAWNEPGGGNNKPKDPWGGGDQGPPDLDEALKKLQDKLGGMFGGRGARTDHGDEQHDLVGAHAGEVDFERRDPGPHRCERLPGESASSRSGTVVRGGGTWISLGGGSVVLGPDHGIFQRAVDDRVMAVMSEGVSGAPAGGRPP